MAAGALVTGLMRLRTGPEMGRDNTPGMTRLTVTN